MDHAERRARRAQLLAELDKLDLERADETAAPRQGQIALERALQEWNEEIIEPKGEVETGAILERYVHAGGLWTWQKTYENRKLAWCGFFAAWCWLSVQPRIRKKCFASTYRLRQWARGTPREIKGLENARAGDIMVISTSNGKAWGDHITIIERVEDDLSGAWTVEGNAYGETPTENRAEGVVRCFRSIEKIKFIYRPLEVDLTE